MSLDLRDCAFFGPALPEPFVKYHLDAELVRRRLLPKSVGEEGRRLQDRWEVLRRKLRELGEQGLERRVASHILEPLTLHLGYEQFKRQAETITREGPEDGGWLMSCADGRSLRCWAVGYGVDLDAPNRAGRAYRFSPSRVAQRVLQAKGERVGLLTDGEELRLLLVDPARPDSHIAILLCSAGGWRASRALPDSYRLLVSLASPGGVQAIPELTDAARLAQATVTKKLRLQARKAVEGFVQQLLDHPANSHVWHHYPDRQELARRLWAEGLVSVYRLLFVFKLESSADPARAFSFATQSLWRNTYSPNTALAQVVRQVLDGGADTGRFLEDALRSLWRMFSEGMSSSELEIKALGGMLFGKDATPLLDQLSWGELAVARLLDALLWTPREGKSERERVHYGSLDVEDLGRVYEALLELDPGITTAPMCRLRRAKLEVVVPLEQGDAYRPSSESIGAAGQEGKPDLCEVADIAEPDDDDTDAEDGEEEESESPKSGKGKDSKTKVLFIEEIPANRFFLRVGLGRKATGSYYTPHPFVRFLVQETLGPQVTQRSPKEDPWPAKLLQLKVLDPAMGSGHFLVEACRYLGDALYEACRLCDGLAVEAELKAEKITDSTEQGRLLELAGQYRQRVADLPDPDDELVAYLPSRVVEGEESGLSQKKAEALCRRLVAVHCLYGVDKNPLAVELAKLSLWLESFAEGLPLTFLDHRLIAGDSLTGPFAEHLATFPSNGKPMEMLATGLKKSLDAAFSDAMQHVADLEASVGKDVADLELKRAAKSRLDEGLAAFKLLASAWTGGVMLGKQSDDEGYKQLALAVVSTTDPTTSDSAIQTLLAARPRLQEMLTLGQDAVPYELTFPEVFYPDGSETRQGFHAVVGNPPWDTLQPKAKEFFAAFDLRVIDAPTKLERLQVEKRLLSDPAVVATHHSYWQQFEATKRALQRLTPWAGRQAGGSSSGASFDLWQSFADRGMAILRLDGRVGWVLPSAFHANQSASGIRELYLLKNSMEICYSFENSKKLFEIHGSFKFAALVARRSGQESSSVKCAFYLHELQWLFVEGDALVYTLPFIKATGGEYLSLLELRSPADLAVAETCFRNSIPFGDVSRQSGVKMSQELHMTHDAHRFTRIDDVLPEGEDPRDPAVALRLRDMGYLPLHEGKTFHQYNDRWGDRPRYLVAVGTLLDKPGWTALLTLHRVAYRAIARSTDERTMISAVLPPGITIGHSGLCERSATDRNNHVALATGSILNSYPFDWLLRQRVAANITGFAIDGTPLPVGNGLGSFLSHAALRLTCNHEGYAALWRDQVGEEWRESSARHSWPVLGSDDERWGVRAAIDAVVAEAYGLSREQYLHVLGSFSHKSYPAAPERCLAAFDELMEMGLEAFSRKHDPYWDVPLNMNLPKPAIDLPLPGGKDDSLLTGKASKKGKQRPKAPLDNGPLFRGKS